MIKVTICEAKKAIPNVYPCLKVNRDNEIVLFIAARKGTVVYANNLADVGTYSDCRNMNDYWTYEGPVTLRNV